MYIFSCKRWFSAEGFHNLSYIPKLTKPTTPLLKPHPRANIIGGLIFLHIPQSTKPPKHRQPNTIPNPTPWTFRTEVQGRILGIPSVSSVWTVREVSFDSKSATPRSALYVSICRCQPARLPGLISGKIMWKEKHIRKGNVLKFLVH